MVLPSRGMLCWAMRWSSLIALSLLMFLVACDGVFVRGGGGSEHGLDHIKIGVPL
jgi:hypothetical protein